MKTTPILLESILPVETASFTIRIWKHEPEAVSDVANDLMVENATRLAIAHKYKLDLAHKLIALTGVNAVEVKDASYIGDTHGRGVVLYKDWP